MIALCVMSLNGMNENKRNTKSEEASIDGLECVENSVNNLIRLNWEWVKTYLEEKKKENYRNLDVPEINKHLNEILSLTSHSELQEKIKNLKSSVLKMHQNSLRNF